MIITRDVITRERSIILPLGSIRSKRQGIHVSVRIDSANDYAKYEIDSILGRLLCPSEPRLLYMKALCHALTSFCLLDDLTGRTGTEEAFFTLRSGAAQPWIPLGTLTQPILKKLRKLSPQRNYYPLHLKRFQAVEWDEDLTMTIQHDGFEPLVRQIMEKSNQLSKFASTTTAEFDLGKPSHLRHRGETHRRLYERLEMDMNSCSAEDTIYVARDREVTQTSSRVHEISRLVRTGCPILPMSTSLVSILESSQVIGGFQRGSHPLLHHEPLISQVEDPINEQWGSLVDYCRLASHEALVLFRLGLLAFNPENSMDAVRSLAAFSVNDELRALKPPLQGSFVDFKIRERPPLPLLQKLIIPAHKTFHFDMRHGRGSSRDRYGRNSQEHLELCESEGRNLAVHILEQWPTPASELSTGVVKMDFIDLSLALEHVKPEWERRRINKELEAYVHQVQVVLDSLQGPWCSPILPEFIAKEPLFLGRRHSRAISLIAHDTFAHAASCREDQSADDRFAPESAKQGSKTSKAPAPESSLEVLELNSLLSRFSQSSDALRRQYGNDLLMSLSAFNTTCPVLPPKSQTPTVSLESVHDALQQSRRMMTLCAEKIASAATAYDSRAAWLQPGGLWPCTSPTSLLGMLRSRSRHSFGRGAKEVLVSYGTSVTNLQRLYRIRRALFREDGRALADELANCGHRNWSPLDHPDWLLLEIDGDFLIRAGQVDVAREIIAPRSGQNSMLQMNMGKGKTSYIVPMVVASLADGKNLSRLIVPKALLTQTAQVVQSRLGGLVGREVCHIPFSRKTKSTPEMLHLYAMLHHKTHSCRGLILTSHEHLLAYKLGGWQHLADSKLEAASTVISFQNWLDNHCRDVLDECDFTLSVKTQLNYPSGSELTVDGHPFRWKIAQELLALVVCHVPALRTEFPQGIEVLARGRSFPMLHFLQSDVENALCDRILDDICTGRTTLLRLVDASTPTQQETIRRALTTPTFDECLFLLAVGAFVNPPVASKILFVVRGLLRNGILLLCLNKRWNVHYGLHPGRHPVAVPLEAKGTPSEQSEFGHPDVAILLTCLAFYYTGLTLDQFRQGLQHVLQSDDPAARYEAWLSGSSDLPEALCHWNVINIDDDGQIGKLWQHVRQDRVVIDHYLNYFVFPTHAKQFQVKLQASAWDIPLFTTKTEQRSARTTGFSGTNDNRMMLPLTIRQDDLPNLRQTSAEVLSYILQPRNRGYQVLADVQGRRLTEINFLQQLHQSNVCVLIDAGAYVVEMDNETLAKTWIGIDTTARAAVYFGHDNRAWVHYRGETKNDVPLLATPFADNLDGCVVYLDQAHTRGIDLKLPVDACGALTLAPKQTKDYTMQAAMRLRQLRTTQSLTFFAPIEVDRSIRDICSLAVNERLDSSHVISWLLEQTCRANEDLRSLYVAQGIDFCRRTDAAWQYQDDLNDPACRNLLLDVLRQPEHEALEQIYGAPRASSLNPGSGDRFSAPELRAFVDQLNREGNDRSVLQIGAFEEVEQQREVQTQVEQVRQVQRPHRHEALTFPGLHPTISCFAETGILGDKLADQHDPGFEHAFAFIANTGTGRKFHVRETNSRLYISTEFGKTARHRPYQESTAENFLVRIDSTVESRDANLDGMPASCGMDSLELLDPDRAGHHPRGGRTPHTQAPSGRFRSICPPGRLCRPHHEIHVGV
ncbi:hypothetical protein GGR58DRAFT_232592 [Xylaria digitata]|nr:hypothetical protein GGR58DRAFT_232592 [Xylaria digitata]